MFRILFQQNFCPRFQNELYKYSIYFILSFLVTVIFVVLITDGYGFRFKNYYLLSFSGSGGLPVTERSIRARLVSSL